MLTHSYLIHSTEPAEEIAEKLHQDILKRIIERILIRFQRGDDYILTAVDKWNIEVLQEAGFLLEDIQKEIAKATPYMEAEIKAAMEDAGVTAMEYDDSIYREAGLDPVPLVQSPYLMDIMQRDFEATFGEWRNFTRTTANAAQQTFIRACDTAYHQAITGTISPSQAVREALAEIVNEGLYVQYPSGRRETIESATARAVRTGIGQTSAHIQLARMKEMGVDLCITSSHLGSRPEHAVWQGKIYSLTGNGYPNFYEATGFGTVTGLGGANCGHSFSCYFNGMGNPFEQYDSEENLKQYEKEQRQRELERRIKKSKRQLLEMQVIIGKSDQAEKAKWESKYQNKAAVLQRQNAEYNQYCKDNDLKRRAERLEIAMWNRSQAAKAREAAKK